MNGQFKDIEFNATTTHCSTRDGVLFLKANRRTRTDIYVRPYFCNHLFLHNNRIYRYPNELIKVLNNYWEFMP